MIELLVSIAIMLIIGGVITTGLVVGLRTTGTTSDRLAQSSDAELLSSYFVPDVESTKKISVTDASCGGGTAVARFTWTEWTNLETNQSVSQTVSYAYLAPTPPANPNGTLVRSHCTGVSMTPIDQQTVARYLTSSVPALVCKNGSGTVSCTAVATPQTVTLTLTDHLDNVADYAFTVSASRRAT